MTSLGLFVAHKKMSTLLAQVKKAREEVAIMRRNVRAGKSSGTGVQYLNGALRQVNRQQDEQDRQVQHVLDVLQSSPQNMSRRTHSTKKMINP